LTAAEQTIDLETAAAIFGTVFLAELGDKTQLATVLFAANRQNAALAVFLAAATALVASTAIAVVAGSALSHYVNPRHLAILAGIGFIVIGAWTPWGALRGSRAATESSAGNVGVTQPSRAAAQIRGEPDQEPRRCSKRHSTPARSPICSRA